MNKNQTWVIRHKITKQHWKARSGKISWAKAGAAKNAWANTYVSPHRIPDELMPYYIHLEMYDTCKFDDQGIYECVDICTDVTLSGDESKELLRLREVAKGIHLLITEADYLHYKDVLGSIKFCTTDLVYYGKLEETLWDNSKVPDLVSYHGKDLTELDEQFKIAVDDYLVSLG